MKSLSGITVLDISRLLPGGFASLLLARQGARVIKIEEPGVGDYYRGLTGGKEFVELGHFLEINSGKELMTLNLKTPQGREIFKKLVRRADIVIENFRPGALERLGLGFRTLSRWNRRLILCSITGGGQRGKGARLGGHDLNYLALSGLLSMIHDRQGDPVIPDFQIVDLAAGYRSVFLILSALVEKRRTGRGQWIDSSMIDVGREMARLYATTRRSRVPLKGHPLSIPNYSLYQARDGAPVVFAALEPKFIRNFGTALGNPPLVSRLHASGLARIFRSKSAREWARLQGRYDFCLSPVLSVEKACGRSRASILPPMGRDNGRILRRLGLSPGAIRTLKKNGVL